MTRKGSIKETGEEISDEKWRRFEAAVGADTNRNSAGTVETDQPYRDEAEHPARSAGDPKTEESKDPADGRDAGKTTQRTE